MKQDNGRVDTIQVNEFNYEVRSWEKQEDITFEFLNKLFRNVGTVDEFLEEKLVNVQNEHVSGMVRVRDLFRFAKSQMMDSGNW